MLSRRKGTTIFSQKKIGFLSRITQEQFVVDEATHREMALRLFEVRSEWT